MAFVVSTFTPHNLLVILKLYLYLSYLCRDFMNVSTPDNRNYKTLCVSQLLFTPNMTEYYHLHNPKRDASSDYLSPVSPSRKLICGLHIAMNFSISMILISLSNDIESNPAPICNFSIPPPNVRGLKISHLNTRSILPNKIDTLRLEMKDRSFDIFSASETWLKHDISDSKIGLPGHSIIRVDRENKVGGGTAIYIRDGIPFKTHSELMCKDLENCMVEISRAKSKKLFICCIYRAPNNPLENVSNRLSSIILKLQKNSEFILLGDFNIDFSQENRSPLKHLLLNFARQFHLDQLIMKPTRITETSKTMIDLIFVANSQRIVRSDVIPCSLSDHSLVFFVCLKLASLKLHHA